MKWGRHDNSVPPPGKHQPLRKAVLTMKKIIDSNGS
jgi:hypothetical protein